MIAAITARPLWLALALLCFAGVLAIHTVLGLMPQADALRSILFPDPGSTTQMMLHYTVLPRLVIALAAGAGLGLAGAMLQQILRNPLAEPATLGISSGSHLMLVVAAHWAPALAVSGRTWIALAGAGVALIAVLALSWRNGLSPVTVTLAGMIVSLYCGTISAILTLFNHDFLVGIFLWGAGYLDQQDWSEVRFLVPRLVVAMAFAGLLLRPLALLEVGDERARSLGLPLVAYRLAALFIAAFLTAIVTAAVGIVSFVGLAAPALVRACGARQTGRYLFWSAAIGALLLAATDQAVQSLPVTYRVFPTGAVTALLGAPLLLLLIPRLKLLAPPPQSDRSAARLRRPATMLAVLAVLSVAACWVALYIGKGPHGWSVLEGDALARMLDLRWPRAVAAFSGGAMLAFAGAVLQRMTGNPMASPEVLGVSSGAMLGVIALLLCVESPTRAEQIASGTAGSAAVLVLMSFLSGHSRFAGDRLLLIGIALSSVSGFIVAVLMAGQDPRLGEVLAWLSGSTYAVRPAEAFLASAMLLAALASIPLIWRWLDLLPLGPETALGAGVPVRISRNALLSISAVLTAAATIVVGPLSFAGLMGPHLARLIGFQRAGSMIAASSLIGGLVLLVADWLGRNIIFPFQVPAGLFATLVGGPLLLALIARRN